MSRVHCLSVRLLVVWIVLYRRVVTSSPCEQSRRLLSLTLWNKKKPTNQFKNRNCHQWWRQHTSHLFTVWVSSFSRVNWYQCIFKCEIYCRGILTFNCDAFNWTLCALITLLFLCRVYWCPFCFTAILLGVLYFWKTKQKIEIVQVSFNIRRCFFNYCYFIIFSSYTQA